MDNKKLKDKIDNILRLWPLVTLIVVLFLLTYLQMRVDNKDVNINFLIENNSTPISNETLVLAEIQRNCIYTCVTQLTSGSTGQELCFKACGDINGK